MRKTRNGIKIWTDELEVVEAVSAMYGYSLKEAEEDLVNGEYTKDEVYRALAWNRAEGLQPFDVKKRWADGEGLQQVIEAYKDEF